MLILALTTLRRSMYTICVAGSRPLPMVMPPELGGGVKKKHTKHIQTKTPSARLGQSESENENERERESEGESESESESESEK